MTIVRHFMSDNPMELTFLAHGFIFLQSEVFEKLLRSQIRRTATSTAIYTIFLAVRNVATQMSSLLIIYLNYYKPTYPWNETGIL